MVDAAIGAFGKIDILVNNAGSSSKLQPFVKMTPEDWQYDIEVDLIWPNECSPCGSPSHDRAEVWAHRQHFRGQGIPNISTYGAAKAGVVMWTEALAREVASQGVIVNAVGPGLGRPV